MVNAWLIYALGGGWGHLNRSLALARKARHDRPVHLMTNSPYVGAIGPELENIQCHAISPAADKQEITNYITDFLSQFVGACLVVDTFPRGIAGELVDLLPQFNGRKILVHRDIAPDYIEKCKIKSFVQQHYDLVLIPGVAEDSPLAQLPQAIITLPWLIRSADECAIVDWRSPQANHHILVVVTGNESERSHFTQILEALLRHFPKLDIRYLADRALPELPRSLWLRHYPGIECLPVADLVIGSAGYNLVYETQAIGVPLIAFAQFRQYDRQEKRSKQATAAVYTIDEMLTAAQMILNQPKSQQLVNYQNGVELAIAAISQLSVAFHDTEKSFGRP